ncbi:glycosyltransferase family 4 protein [Corynebacterium guaraldiae]|nr:glycosyltransferase family 4 protein [Corynebacterium guaraldiae]
MRILILSQYWHPEDGVPQRRWTWLTRVLKSQGHEVLVMTPPPNYQRHVSYRDWIRNRGFSPVGGCSYGPSGERILRSGFLPSNGTISGKVASQAFSATSMAWLLISRRTLLREFEPQLIIGTVPALPVALLSRCASRILSVPYAIDLRDAWPDLLDDSDQWNEAVGHESLREKVLKRGPLQLLKLFARISVNNALENASKIFVTSEKLGYSLQEKFSRHSVGNTVFTLRNVFPVASEVSQPRHANAKPRNTLRVLYAGTLGRAQDLSNAIMAAKRASELGADIELKFIGIGAAKEALREQAAKLGVHAEFISRRASDSLEEYYQWADTALVHLADWEPLTRTVPSKTYELMASQIFITGVVEGETAELIESLGAGTVVPPKQPEALAAMWVELAKCDQRAEVDGRGREWVLRERLVTVPETLRKAIGAESGELKGE